MTAKEAPSTQPAQTYDLRSAVLDLLAALTVAGVTVTMLDTWRRIRSGERVTPAEFVARLGLGPAETLDAETIEASRTLGVTIGACADEIRAAFRRRLLEVHPDHGGSDEETRRLIAAREVLLCRLEDAA